MARNRKRQANGTAWYHKFDDGWCTTIDAKRTRLRDATGSTIKGKDLNRDGGMFVVKRLESYRE